MHLSAAAQEVHQETRPQVRSGMPRRCCQGGLALRTEVEAATAAAARMRATALRKFAASTS